MICSLLTALSPSQYWSLQGQGLREKDYSYAYAAAAQGMATFRYDRLGVGKSSKPTDGYK